MNEIRDIGGHEFIITNQVWYDAYMMSLPEFVTYYSITSQFSDRHDLGFSFRELFFELRDRMVTEKTVDKTLKKSQLRIWLAERDLTLKDVEKDVPQLYTAKQSRSVDSLEQANPLVEKGSAHAKEHRPKQTNKPSTPLLKSTEIESVEKIEYEREKKENRIALKEAIDNAHKAGREKAQSDEPKGSRLDQVKYWIEQGHTTAAQIAAKSGIHPSYVARLIKQI